MARKREPQQAREKLPPVVRDNLNMAVAAATVAACIVAWIYAPPFLLVGMWSTAMMTAAFGISDLLASRTSKRLSTFAMCAAGAVYVPLASYVVPPPFAVLNGLAVLTWATVVIGWERLADRTPWSRRAATSILRARALAAIRENWTVIVSYTAIPKDSELLEAEETHDGFTLAVQTPGDATVAHRTAGLWASLLHLPKRSVTIAPDSNNNSIFHVGIQLRDPLAEVVPWSIPTGDKITVPVPIGRNKRGHRLLLPLHNNHVLCCGATGSGKTMTLHSFCAHAAAAPDAHLIVIDTAKHGADFRMWANASLMFGESQEEAQQILAWVYALAKARYKARSRAGVAGDWRPSAVAGEGGEGPQIVVVIDETANAVRDDRTAEILEWIAAEARGAGITLVLGTQTPHHKIFSSNMRKNMTCRICLSVESSTASNMVLYEGAASQGYDGSQLPLDSQQALVIGAKTKHGKRRREPERCRLWHVNLPSMITWATGLEEEEHMHPHPALGDATESSSPDAAPVYADWLAPAPGTAHPEPAQRARAPQEVAATGVSPPESARPVRADLPPDLDTDVLRTLWADPGLSVRALGRALPNATTGKPTHHKTLAPVLVRLQTAGLIVSRDGKWWPVPGRVEGDVPEIEA